MAGGEAVCEIKHATYYQKHPQRWGEGVCASLEDREARREKGGWVV